MSGAPSPARRSRSGGHKGRRRKDIDDWGCSSRSTLNCAIAQYVVAPDVDTSDLEKLMRTTPAHVVFLLFEAALADQRWSAQQSQKDAEGTCQALKHAQDRCQSAVQNSGRHKAEWVEGGAVLLKGDRGVGMAASRGAPAAGSPCCAS